MRDALEVPCRDREHSSERGWDGEPPSVARNLGRELAAQQDHRAEILLGHREAQLPHECGPSPRGLDGQPADECCSRQGGSDGDKDPGQTLGAGSKRPEEQVPCVGGGGAGCPVGQVCYGPQHQQPPDSQRYQSRHDPRAREQGGSQRCSAQHHSEKRAGSDPLGTSTGQPLGEQRPDDGHHDRARRDSVAEGAHRRAPKGAGPVRRREQEVLDVGRFQGDRPTAGTRSNGCQHHQCQGQAGPGRTVGGDSGHIGCLDR